MCFIKNDVEENQQLALLNLPMSASADKNEHPIPQF